MSKIYEQNFDLLLLDVNVPKKSGFEVLKEVRAIGKTTPAIFITSLNSMSSLEEDFLVVVMIILENLLR